MEDLFKTWVSYLATGIEACAGIIIAFASIEAIARALLLFFNRRETRAIPSANSESQDAKEALRLHLGKWLSVALEFTVAADILRTAVAPSWNEIGKLAAIIVLRTALNYFLQREIDQATTRRKEREAQS